MRVLNARQSLHILALNEGQTWKEMLEKELWPNSQPACARVCLRSVDSIAGEMA